MPHMILVGGSGNALTYNLSGLQSFEIEALTTTVDTTGVAFGVQSSCDVIYKDNAGFLIARSRSSKTLPDGTTLTVTFAPWLPDTLELGNDLAGLVNTTGLCATTLPPQGSVTVQATDPAAIVKGFRMWVEDANLDGAGNFKGDLALGPYLLVPGLAA